MDDVRYIATHPLLQRILRRCGELKNQVEELDQGAERRELVRRLVRLEQYGLPKPDGFDQHQWRAIPAMTNDLERVVLPAGQSLRQRYKGKRRGRPDLHRIAVRAALEEKIRNPRRTWRSLAAKFGLEVWDLERQIRLLKTTLKQEGIALPTMQDCRNAEKFFQVARQGFSRARRRDDALFAHTTVLSRYRQHVLVPEMACPVGPGFSCQ
jgi:hypothetical protein